MEIIKKIIQVGGSLGVIFDKVVLDTLKLKKGDKVFVNIEKDDNL